MVKSWVYFICVYTYICLFDQGVNAKGTYVNETFLNNPKYISYDKLGSLFNNIVKSYPHIAKVHTLGQSVRKRNILALEINSNVNNRLTGTPMFKFVANMHGDETLGYALMVFLSQYLVYNYNKDPRVTKMVNSTDIFIVPSINPDGYSSSVVSLILPYFSVLMFICVILIITIKLMLCFFKAVCVFPMYD